MRVCWNPRTSVLYTRHTNPVELLPVHRTTLPKIFVDGELWAGRCTFQELRPVFSFLYKKLNFAWETLRLCAFDVPSPDFQRVGEVFEKRFEFLLESVLENHPFIYPVVRMLCENREFMDQYAKIIIASGGEGVMLRKPRSVYENGRSHSILKYKTSRDSEARVIKKQGIYCECELPGGITFTAKSEMEDEVEIGDIVSFKYVFLSKAGVPHQPLVFSKRYDLKWGDVINLVHKSSP